MSLENRKSSLHEVKPLFVAMICMLQNPGMTIYFFKMVYDQLNPNPPFEAAKNWYDSIKHALQYFFDAPHSPSYKEGMKHLAKVENTSQKDIEKYLAKYWKGGHGNLVAKTAWQAVRVNRKMRFDYIDPLYLNLLEFVHRKRKLLPKGTQFDQYNFVNPNNQVSYTQYAAAVHAHIVVLGPLLNQIVSDDYASIFRYLKDRPNASDEEVVERLSGGYKMSRTSLSHAVKALRASYFLYLMDVN